jgi:hypothetical protein
MVCAVVVAASICGAPPRTADERGEIMRKIIGTAAAALAVTGATLVATATPAAAAPACKGFSVPAGGGRQGALAMCEAGTVGDIRVVITCLTEAHFKRYNKFGVWRHQTATGFTLSEAYCRGNDAMIKHWHQAG